MIIKPIETTVAYRCPHCGGFVTNPVGVFSLSGDMYRLKCPCGHSAMTITYDSDDKIRLEVPCIVCPSPHNYVISRAVFFGRELFTLLCTYSGIELCYIGKSSAVKEAFDNATRELAEMAGLDEDEINESGDGGNEDGADDSVDDDADDGEDENDGVDGIDESVIRGMIRKKGGGNSEGGDDPDAEKGDTLLVSILDFLIAELVEENAIKCNCRTSGDGEYGYEFTDDGIRVFCRKCGASRSFPIDSAQAADDWINCDMLDLT